MKYCTILQEITLKTVAEKKLFIFVYKQVARQNHVILLL